MNLCYLASDPGHLHVKRWVEWFRDAGHSVSLIGPAGSAAPRYPGIRYERLWAPRGSTRFRGVWQRVQPFVLRCQVQRLAADILHVQWLDGLADAAGASGFRPLVLTAWGSDVLAPHLGQGHRPSLRAALRKADAVTADSREQCERLIDLGASPERTHEILWGVDTDVFGPGPIDPSLRARLGIAAGPVVMSIRQFREHYNHETTVRAMPRVLAECPGAKFVFLHGPNVLGNDQRTVYYRRLQLLAVELGVAHACRWVDGGVAHSEMADALQCADICVSIPERDGTAVSMLEAMACGKPVVASDLAANRQWLLEKGEAGRLVPVRDVDALGAALTELLRDASTRCRLGATGRSIAVEWARQDANMTRMAAIYAQLVRSR